MAASVREWTEPAAAGAERPFAGDEESVRALMWRDVGLWREGPALASAVASLAALDRRLERRRPESRAPGEWRLANLVTVGRLMAQAALRRTESRGGHYRADFPARDDVHWSAHITERMR